MNTFCLIFKSVGDYLLPIIGILFAAGTIFPALGKWFKHKESAMKASRLKSLFFGISLAVFCIALIAASVRIQLTQSRQQAIQSSLHYQQQMALKYEIESLAKYLSKTAIDFDKNQEAQADFQGHDLKWLQSVTFDLTRQGLSIDKVKEIYDESQRTGRGATSETLKKMSDELNKLAAQLPTSQ